MQMTFTNGESIPRIGLGTWPMDDTEAAAVVADAIELGYRLVDTAFAYGNEIGVGRGVKDSGVPREEMFITTKFNRHSHSVSGVAEAWEDSARKLGVDYIDLMLIHWPNPDQDRYVEAWEGLIAIQEQGKVRHIGVSTFLREHLDRIIGATGVVPALNQLQINPRHAQAETVALNDELGIVSQSWSPLGQGNDLLAEPLFTELAEKYACTPGQVVLAWQMSQVHSTIPKSANPKRLAQNLQAQHIVLDADDVARISEMDGTEQDVKNPSTFMH
jgi:2,5-diketo-D-gluconate reductase A